MLRAVSKVSVTLTKKWNQRTMGHLISYSKNSESDNPPPDTPPPPHCAQPSHVNTAIWPSYIIPVPTQSSHANPVPARSSQVNPALANWHSIESATCQTSLTPKLVFNPETEQCFCLVNNQLILTLILYVLDSQTPVIGLEPHPSNIKHWCFID